MSSKHISWFKAYSWDSYFFRFSAKVKFVRFRRLESAWGSTGPVSGSDLEQWVAQLLSRLDSSQRAAVRLLK